MAGAEEPRRSFAFTFGLERLGLITLGAPWLSALLIVAISVLTVFGVMRLRVDDSLSELFRTNTPEFQQYEAIDRLFPSSEYDVLVVIEGVDLLKRDKLAAVSSTIVELQLAEGVNGVVSMLSARGKPDATGYAPPVVPDQLPEGDAYDAMIKTLRANEIVAGKFLSDDGTLALAVISLDRKTGDERGAKAVIGGIREAAEKGLEGAGLKVQLTGAPVMQLEIRNAVERDQIVYNLLGLVFGAAIALVFFRRLSFMLIAAVPPVVAVVWSLGVLGWLGFKMNLFLNVMTPLVMVMGFADSMQMACAIRDRLRQGDSKREALAFSTRVVGPACVLAHVTALISFLALLISDSALIYNFGLAGILATLVSYIAVIGVMPLAALLAIQLGDWLSARALLAFVGILLLPVIALYLSPWGQDLVLFGRRVAEDRHYLLGGVVLLGLVALVLIRERPLTREHLPSDRAMDWLGNAVGAIVDRVVHRPYVTSVIGLVTFAVLSLAYLKLEPRYRLADQVPDREQALKATGRLDQKLTGANPVHVMIRWHGPNDLYDKPTLDVIAKSHAVLEKTAGLGNVWSLESLRRWLADAGDTRIETVKDYVKVLPEHLVRRFIAAQEKAVLVTGRLPDVDASQILPVVEKIDQALNEVRRANPGYEISVTGLPAIAARSSAGMIRQLMESLPIAVGAVAILIGLAFRAFSSAAISLIPGIFPVVGTGAGLWLLGQGIEFASVVALIVIFGLGIDALIHFLNRLSREERAGEDAAIAIRRARVLVGPAIILTTVVLAFGLGVTVFSALPSLRLFGAVCGVALLASLIGDLVFLPAFVAVIRRLWPIRPATM